MELPDPTKTERTDGTVTEVPSALPQSDEPIVANSRETISSTPKVEDGALNNSIPEVESSVRAADFASSSSGRQ